MYDDFVRLCQEKGVTTYQVCKDTGISQGTISNWKNRGNSLSYKTLVTLADYFGVPVEAIMGSTAFDFNPETKTWEPKKKREIRKPSGEGMIEKAAPKEECQEKYYIDGDAEKYAQFLLDHPEYKVLFDASTKVKPEDLKKALAAIGLFIDEE